MDEHKNANNFLALGPHSVGKTWNFTTIREQLCIPETVKNISRLTGAGLDCGDENGFMYIMDELGEDQLSAEGKNPIRQRLKSCLTEKFGGTQAGAFQETDGGPPMRTSVFTKN